MKKKNDVSDRKADRDFALVKCWTRWLKRGWSKKGKFTKTAREVDSYFKGEHDSFYDSDALRQWCDLEHAPKLTINLAFQIRGWLAPNLYQRNPTRKVTARTNDSVLVAFTRVVEAVLNYTPNECHLADESRIVCDEAVMDGRGASYSGIDDVLGLPTTWRVAIEDVVIDPDARRPEDALWIAYRRRIPIWQVEEDYASDEAKRVSNDEGLRQTLCAYEPDNGEADDETTSADDEDEDGTNELVTVYEVYSRMGYGWRGLDVPEEFADLDDSVKFRKIVLVEGHDRPVFLGRWETDLYVDRVWPFSFLDLTPTKNSLWPVSLMAAAMPHQRAINLLSTIALDKAKTHARELIAVPKGLPQEVKDQIVTGGLTEVLEVAGNDPSMRLSDLVQKWESGAISPEIREQIAFHMDMFGQITGLLPILKGSGSEQQIRSATEADIRDRNARSRLTDLAERVEDWASDVARKEGLLLRLECEAEDVDRVVGGSLRGKLGWRLCLKTLGVELPIRTGAPEPGVDGMQPIPDGKDASLQRIAPEFAIFYETVEDAFAASQALAMKLPELSLRYALLFDGPPTVYEVSVADVWAATSYLSARDLAREVSFRVETGSSKRPDPNRAIDQANTLMAAVAQPALQAGDVGTYNAVLGAVYEAQGFSPDMRIFLSVAPPPGAAKGGPQPAGPALPTAESAGASPGPGSGFGMLGDGGTPVMPMAGPGMSSAPILGPPGMQPAGPANVPLPMGVA